MLTANHDAGLHILANPAGTFHFVGSVPPALAFDYQDESDLAAAIQCGPAIAKRIAERNGRTFLTRSFPTRAAACRAAAEWNGTTFVDVDGRAYHPDAPGRIVPVFNVNGAGFKGGTVKREPAALVGVYAGGTPYQPERDSVRALLPYQWRAAWDRRPTLWWNAERTQAYAHLTDARGRPLTTVYANVQWESV